MDDKKYSIQYQIKELRYNFGTASDEPKIVLMLTDFKFGETNHSMLDIGGAYGGNAIWLYLNKSTFSKLTDRSWDGSPEDVERLKKNLEGKVFSLDLRMKTKR